jgi:bifunctional non-homologous end joining protein LigD
MWRDAANGFTAALRAELFKRFRGLYSEYCPFANLREAKSGRWGVGLTAAKMQERGWLKPELVAQVEFAEWTLGQSFAACQICGAQGR